MRKFEIVKTLAKVDMIKLPERSTKNSAGYDFFNPEDITLAANTVTLVKTGIKAKFPEDETLLLFNRSSNPTKKGLILLNGVGVVDADYYGNEDNDGEIGFAFYNMKGEDVILRAGEKLGQGIFVKFGTVDGDNATGERKSGWGSTGK